MDRHPNLVGEDLEAAKRTYVRCRAMRFHFMEPQAGHGWVPEFGYGIGFRCANCGTWRFDTRSPITHELLARSYDYPPGYEMAVGEHHDQAYWMSEWVDELAEEFVVRKEAAPEHRRAVPRRMKR